MNIVYRLVNTDRDSGKRFYIGSKKECTVVQEGDVKVIRSIRTNRPYLGSSQSLEMKEDLINCRFTAEVLEEVPWDKNIYEYEQKWIEFYSAVNSDEYYNISDAILKNTNIHTVVNKFGETVNDMATNNRTQNTIEKNAIKLGYSNAGEFFKAILEMREDGLSFKTIGEKFNKNWKSISRIVKGYTLEKFVSECESIDKDFVIDTLKDGASKKKVAELLCTNYYVISFLLCDFNLKNDVATFMNLSRIEAEDLIGDLVVTQDKSFMEISNELKISKSSVSRYFISYAKRRLKSSDL